jgi:GTP:adenosylcobinamide-phosphate guanylyltransferase
MNESALLRSDASPIGPRCAIVLAGRRSTDDPLATAAGAPHRALLDIEGEPMLVRVVKRLLAWPTIERILINIDRPALLLDLAALVALRDAGSVEFMQSTESPSRSVLESLDWADLASGPVLVTTADHALLDDDMLDAFLGASEQIECDLTVGLVSRVTIEARFPEAKRTYLRFRDGAFSGANLFLFRTPNAERAAAFWRRVENERKHPWRMARAFGLGTLLLFLTRRLDLDAAFVRASSVIGAKIRAIRLHFAEAAVDVDKIEDLELVQRILAERRDL